MQNTAKRQRQNKRGEEVITTNTTIGIVGLGYVGLRLAHIFDEEGFTVHGFDVDEEKIQQLQAGTDPTHEVGSQKLQSASVSYSTATDRLEDCEYIILSVPTPITDSKEPDLSFIEAAGETIGSHLTKDTTVVLESTVYPGATREVLLPALESPSELVAGDDFFVGYSPERVVPGEDGRDFREIVKIVSAHDEMTARRLQQLYERPLEVEVHIAPTIETAEAAKCLENVQRDLNIGLMNEFAIACHEVDFEIDFEDVRTAAGTKWNFHQYRPGLVGGHCLPVDPYFIMDQFEQHGFSLELPETARRINEQVPAFVTTQIMDALNRRRESTGTQSGQERLLIAGLAYKPDSADIRSSPVDTIIAALQEYEVDLIGYEPRADNKTLVETFGIPFQDSFSVTGLDVLVVPTPHQELRQLELSRLSEAMNDEPVLVDISRAFNEDQARDCGFTYVSL